MLFLKVGNIITLILIFACKYMKNLIKPLLEAENSVLKNNNSSGTEKGLLVTNKLSIIPIFSWDLPNFLMSLLMTNTRAYRRHWKKNLTTREKSTSFPAHSDRRLAEKLKEFSVCACHGMYKISFANKKENYFWWGNRRRVDVNVIFCRWQVMQSMRRVWLWNKICFLCLLHTPPILIPRKCQSFVLSTFCLKCKMRINQLN